MKVELDYTSLLTECVKDFEREFEEASDAVARVNSTRSYVIAASMLNQIDTHIRTIWSVTSHISDEGYTGKVMNDMFKVWGERLDDLRDRLKPLCKIHWICTEG